MDADAGQLNELAGIHCERSVMDLSVQNMYGLLIRSRLLSLDDAKKMFERWTSENKESGDVDRFARWMVAQRYITDYQASLLARGHADGFFLGQYKILERIGRGRMAGVFKAVHPLGQTVAIKVLPPSRARDPKRLRRFIREARMAQTLKHPNVVRTFHVGKEGRLYYLVMEYLDGETLAEVLDRRGKLPPAEAVRVVHQALTGLQYLHEKGLVHRDLKPANLMLVAGTGESKSGKGPDTTLRSTVKILDIGLARLQGNGRSDGSSHHLTSPGTLLGTPNYMAPEQARDPRQVDIRSDIYSLGCVLYHTLTGQPPFPESNVVTQMIRHATEPPKPLRELNPAIPDGLQQIVSWMLAKDPAQRYPTPGRAAQALQVFLVAGNEAPAIEQDPKMRSYLTWVEAEGSDKAKQELPKVSAQAIPIAVPKEGRTPRRARSAKAAVENKAAAFEFDVELVSVPMPAPIPAGKPPRGLSRRDFVAFGLGAGSVLLAILLGWLMAVLLRQKPPADE